jgi:hypothetical protein
MKHEEEKAVGFFVGLSLLCASTLMYEIVLTRLLSVLFWYYLAFVSISMAMFGMTAGALVTQMRPDLFDRNQIPNRLAQATFAMAVSTPLALIILLAIPLEISLAVQTLFSFLLVSAVMAVPFFFSGVAVCLSLTRSAFPVGRVYFADLLGAAVGCLGAVWLLSLIDAPSAIFVVSSLLFVSAAAYATHAGDKSRRSRSYAYTVAMIVVAALNVSTLHGIQPIWSKGQIDRRDNLAAEVWNPISKVRASGPHFRDVSLWGPSPIAPRIQAETMEMDVDNDAGFQVLRFRGDPSPYDNLDYDVTSVGAQMRAGGTAAIIGVGGGRDAVICAVNGFHRIVGIEVNGAVVKLVTKRFGWFSRFDEIPGLELHNDEGRSYLTRSRETYDMIQASLVDTWAATSAGAMTLAENSLYTVDAWQIFYRHLRPGGLITFSRWYFGAEITQTYRLVAVAWATLLSQGVRDPSRNIALLSSGLVATILVSNQPFSDADLRKLHRIADQMKFQILLAPDEPGSLPELRSIAAAHSLGQLVNLRDSGDYDYSPVFDSSPYFFNSVRLRKLPHMIGRGGHGANLRALFFVFAFMLAAVALVIVTILLPLFRRARRFLGPPGLLAGAMAYFIFLGLGFMLVEIAMMQQLSIFLGHPIYSLVVVLAGLILSTGIGSLVSDRLELRSSVTSRLPAFIVSLGLLLYSAAVIPVIHRFVADVLWQRVALSLALVGPCGFLMGFCFPVGLRWLRKIKQEENLPWMWALNGAAATLGSFVAILISMERSIATCVLTGAACYLVAAAALPSRSAVSAPLEAVAARDDA